MNHTFLVVVPFYWGIGNTIAEAKKKIKGLGYSKRFPDQHTHIYCFPETAKPHLDEMGNILWSGKSITPLVIQEPNKSWYKKH